MFANSARFAVVVAAFLWLSFRAPLPDARAQLAPGNPLLGGPNQAGPAIGPAAGLVPHPAGNVANVVGAPGVGPGLAAGGGAQADFDSLIDLIQSTVAADSWVENGGGQGDIRPFAGGVWVDSSGLVQRVNPSRDFSHPLLHATSFGADEVVADAADPRRTSRLRCVSLPRLERAMARLIELGQPLTPAMLTLAGLNRAQFLLVYPDTGDVVLAGPAGAWETDPLGRLVCSATGEPVVRVDDLIALLRRSRLVGMEPFGCSINPRPDALADAQQFLSGTRGKPIHPARRDAWLERLRSTLGQQDIVFFGIEPQTRIARVLLEADYHMKLVGMGIEDGVLGVESYLDTVTLGPDGSLPPMSVLRWWFALRYKNIEAAPDENAFALRGQGAQVLCENELLTEQGRRVHTGRADPLTQRFANCFTSQFDQLLRKYPVYGELRNIFDLAVLVSLIERYDVLARTGWKPQLFVDPRLALPQASVPKSVETVANYRVIGGRHIVAGVSGGVWVEVSPLTTAESVRRVTNASLEYHLSDDSPPADPARWWWDP